VSPCAIEIEDERKSDIAWWAFFHHK